VQPTLLGNTAPTPRYGARSQTNVDDVEAHIKRLEDSSGQKVLEAIDLPALDREWVMEELRYMGITAASMFPGLDGVCEEQRELNFPR